MDKNPCLYGTDCFWEFYQLPDAVMKCPEQGNW